MSIADKLVTIAENMQRMASRVYIRTIDFGADGFAGVGSTPMKFDHGLGKEPIFVAIYANNPEAVLNDTSSTTFVLQADRFLNNNCSYLRCANGTVVVAVNTATDRLITYWDDTCIKVNAAAASYPWPPNTITTFTMICVA